MPQEHKRLISTSKHVPKLRYRGHAKKCKPLLHCTELLERDDIEVFGLLRENEHI